ncbi:MAG TPA: hypothetical protein VFO86_02345 [Terriglobia bacterium]|nr:hypothetical protein [Terriglobia bacterium]
MKVAFISTMESMALRLLGYPESKKRQPDAFNRWDTGYPVRIRKSRRIPLSSKVGQIISVDPADKYGPFLVHFSNGLQFRYQEDEFTALPRVEQENLPGE